MAALVALVILVAGALFDVLVVRWLSCRFSRTIRKARAR